MGRGGQKADVRRMAAIDVRMRHAAEHGEIVAEVLEQFQVRRQGVVRGRCLSGKNGSASTPRLLQMANMRRGTVASAGIAVRLPRHCRTAAWLPAKGSDMRDARGLEELVAATVRASRLDGTSRCTDFACSPDSCRVRPLDWTDRQCRTSQDYYFDLKQIALNNFHHQASNAILAIGSALENLFDFLAIGKSHRRTGGVNRSTAAPNCGQCRLHPRKSIFFNWRTSANARPSGNWPEQSTGKA